MSEMEDLSNVLTSNYLIASVHVSTWSGKKTDQEASRELTTAKGASDGAAKVVKDLLKGCDSELKDAQAAYNALRTFFYQATVPWGMGGSKADGLVGVADSFKFMAEFAKRKGEAEIVRDAFLAVLSSRVAQAQAAQGGLYKADDYPDVVEVRSMFGATMQVRPMPAVSDFTRANIPAALITGLSKKYEQQATAQVDNAVMDLRDRLTSAVERMHTQLSKVASGEAKTRLYASLLTNLQQLVGLAQSLAPMSAELGELATRIKTELLVHEIDAYKGNAGLSRSVAEKAAAIMSVLDPQGTAVQVVLTDTRADMGISEPDGDAHLQVDFVEEQDTKIPFDVMDNVELPDIEDLL